PHRQFSLDDTARSAVALPRQTPRSPACRDDEGGGMTFRVRTVVTTALSAAALALLGARTAPATDARIAHSTDPATVVVSYTVTLGEIASADGGPSVRIYGDGRVEAHYPAYMKGAGHHGARL